MKVSVYENGNVVDQIAASNLTKKDFDTKEMSFTSKNNHMISIVKENEYYRAYFYFNGKRIDSKSTTRLANMKQYIRSEIKK